MKKRNCLILPALLLAIALILCGCGQPAAEPTEVPETTLSAEALREEQLAKATELFASQKFAEAAELYKELGEEERWATCIYQMATRSAASGELDTALTQLEPIADTPDGQRLIQRLITTELTNLAGESEPDTARILELAGRIEDKSFMTGWDYNDLNRILYADAVMNGDYAGAIEHVSRCEYEDHKAPIPVFEAILAENYDEALRLINENAILSPGRDISKSWLDIIYERVGTPDTTTLDGFLTDRYYRSRVNRWELITTMDSEAKLFDENSFLDVQYHIGAIEAQDGLWLIDDIDAFYAQCGSAPNGKVLIVREQQEYPKGGVYYAVDTALMGGKYPVSGIYSDLYPSSLSEVEYIITVSFDYDHVNYQKLITTWGDSKTETKVAFLRLKAQVKLTELATGNVLYQSKWVKASNAANPWSGDSSGENPWVGSDMPQYYASICAAAEKALEQKQ